MQVSKQESNDFINKVFNYYNGKINIFNKARMFIDWGLHLDTTTGGISMNPNIMYVFPRVILRFFPNPYWFKYNLVVCIIHELFHIDQDVNYHRMMVDPEYCQMIEHTVEIETYLYIANHRKEIYHVAGIADVVPEGGYYQSIVTAGFEHGYIYHRMTYYSHILSILQDLTHENQSETIDNVMKIMRDPNSKLELLWLRELVQFTLKDGPLCMPLEQLNDILYDLYFKYTLRGSRLTLLQKDANSYILNIETRCSNLMYKPCDHVIQGTIFKEVV